MNIFKQSSWPYLLVVGAISLLVIPMLLVQDMFVDGLIYSTISNNLANGEGTFWQPYYTGDVYNPFHEHPPLVFGIQSWFFKIFGDGYLTERIFCLFTLFVGLFLIHKIWQEITPKKKHGLSWLPMLLWIITPHVFWSYQHNMLENSITMFSLLAVLFILKGSKEEANMPRRISYLCISAAALFCSFLSKGFVGLFPLALPTIIFLTDRKPRHIVNNAILGGVLVLIALIVFMNDAAYESIMEYINTQVKGSLTGERVVVRRTLVMEQLLLDLLPAITLTALLFLIRRKRWNQPKREDKSFALIFFLIGLSASIPMMVSPKQLAFYIVPAVPYMAIAVSLLVSSQLSKEFREDHKRVYAASAIVGLGLMISGIAWSTQTYRDFARNEDMIYDVNLVSSSIESESFGIHYSISEEWSMFAYFKRMHNIDSYRDFYTQPYLLVKKGNKAEKGYVKIELETRTIDVYQRVD